MDSLIIRGIYATALTKLLMDNGFKIVQPSLKVARRLGLKPSFEAFKVQIVDKSDRQGIKVIGEAPEAERVVECLRKFLPDVIVRECYGFDFRASGGRVRLATGFLSFEVEFPGGSKLFLDDVRNLVKPTLIGHHQLKIVDARKVERAEALLDGSDEMRRELSFEVKEELVYRRLTAGSEVAFEHVKVDGRILYLRPGRIVSLTDRILKVKRGGFKAGGVYNGVKIPKEEGDYALTEIRERAWLMKHSYYNLGGDLKYEYYNINTPVEFYPDRVRYVDLEVDVVREVGGRHRIVDLDKLDSMVSEGYLSEELALSAKRVAGEVAKGKIGWNSRSILYGDG